MSDGGRTNPQAVIVPRWQRDRTGENCLGPAGTRRPKSDGDDGPMTRTSGFSLVGTNRPASTACHEAQSRARGCSPAGERPPGCSSPFTPALCRRATGTGNRADAEAASASGVRGSAGARRGSGRGVDRADGLAQSGAGVESQLALGPAAVDHADVADEIELGDRVARQADAEGQRPQAAPTRSLTGQAHPGRLHHLPFPPLLRPRRRMAGRWQLPETTGGCIPGAWKTARRLKCFLPRAR